MKRILSVRCLALAAVLAALLCLTLTAQAEKAQEITTEVGHAGIQDKNFARMCDNKFTTSYQFQANRSVTLTYEGGISGITLEHLNKPVLMQVEAQGADGTWQVVATTQGYITEWVAVPEGTTAIRLSSVKRGSRPRLSEIHVYGPGDKPDEAPEWQLAEKADLMVIVAHPDDELLWFGGMLPTYAAERGYTVQVVYATANAERKLELLHGLWTCGVHYYPTFYELVDEKLKSTTAMYNLWGKTKFRKLIVESIRKYKPEVVATHDFNGEYGHNAHKITAESVAACMEMTADATQFKTSAETYGTWEVKKLYVHLWSENQIHLDWTVPLTAFDGETGISVATRALAWHKSQTESKRAWSMDRAKDYDNGLFGLYYTTVGPDEAGDDLFEHITAAE